MRTDESALPQLGTSQLKFCPSFAFHRDGFSPNIVSHDMSGKNEPASEKSQRSLLNTFNRVKKQHQQRSLLNTFNRVKKQQNKAINFAFL